MKSSFVGSAFRLTVCLLCSGILMKAQEIREPLQTAGAAVYSAAVPANHVLLAFAEPSPSGVASSVASPDPAVLASPQPLVTPVAKPDTPSPSRFQVQAWRGLVIAEHSAAIFDAWSTRDSLASGNGYERNPLMKPFANSNAIYPVLQIAPVGFDYLGHRLMRSHNTVLRRAWWVPQAASMTASIWCGARNVHVANLQR